MKTRLLLPDERKRFGAALREKRRELGLTQEKLGFACDLDRTYISDIEGGKRNPSLVNILRLCKVLGVSAAELFSRARL